MISQYSAVIKAHFSAQLQYRTAAWAGIGTQLFFGLIKVMIFTGFFQSSLKEQPMSYDQVINYLWLGQAMLMILPFRADRELASLIKTGNVAYELSRPVSLYKLWYARAIAMRLAPVFLRVIPMVLAAGFILPLMGAEQWALEAPGSLSVFFYFSLSVIAAFFLAASISVLMSISVMWTVSSAGIDQLMPSLIWIFSGIIIPLPFFPGWMQKIFYALPFRGMLDIPFRIYTGNITSSHILFSLGVQLFWIIVMIWIGSFLLKKGLRRIVVQGG